MHLSFLSSYKKEFRAYLSVNKENLHTSEISINPNELYKNSKHIIWEDDNKEIVYNGVLYDVVSVQNNKKNVILTVFSDTQEENIKKQFAANYDDESNKTTNKPMKLLKQFLTLKYLSQTSDFINTPATTDIIINNKDYPFYLSEGFLTQETPPPNFFI